MAVLGRDFFFPHGRFLATDRFLDKSDAVEAIKTSSKQREELVTEAVSVPLPSADLVSIIKLSSCDSLRRTELLKTDISLSAE